MHMGVIVLGDFCHTSNLCCYVAAVWSCHGGRHYAGEENPEKITGAQSWIGALEHARYYRRVFYKNSILDHFHTLTLKKLSL